MKKIILWLKTFQYIKKEGLICPSNIIRILGILTHQYAFVGPLKVYIGITSHCDMYCIMCWFHSPYLSNTVNSEYLPFEKFLSLISDFKQIGVKAVVLGGEGEPLLHPRILDMVKAARESGLEVEILTNGFYLEKEKIDFLLRIGIKKLLISLHCSDEATFKLIHPLREETDFSKIIKNIKLIKTLQGKSPAPRIFLINVISRKNYQKTSEMARLASELGADKLLFKPLMLDHDIGEQLLNVQEKEILIKNLRALEKEITLPNNINAFIQTTNRDLLAKKGSRPQKRMTRFCYIPWVSSNIAPGGDVLPCVYAHKKFAGNMNALKFSDIWKGDAYKSFRQGKDCPETCLGKAVYPFLSA